MSLRGMFEQANEVFGRVFYIIPSHPKVAQIEVTNVCNFNCIMCQRKYLGVQEKHIDYAKFEGIIDRLDGVKDVILCGWGEPLCHPRIIDMIRYAKKNKLNVSLTSNGSLLDGKMQDRLIDSQIDSISFSIDDTIAVDGALGHVINNQIENITAFAAKRASKGGKPNIVLQTTYHKHGEDSILRVIELAAKLGACINVNRLDVRFNKMLKRPTYLEETEFVKRMIGRAEDLGVTAEFKPHTAYRGLKQKLFRTLKPFFHKGGRHCLRVFNYVYIDMDGYVTPCCALPRHRIGNIFKENLTNIWSNGHFDRFRDTDFQRSVCGRCDVLELRQKV